MYPSMARRVAANTVPRTTRHSFPGVSPILGRPCGIMRGMKPNLVALFSLLCWSLLLALVGGTLTLMWFS